MKVECRRGKDRATLSALVTVMAVLMAAMIAKIDVAIQLGRLWH